MAVDDATARQSNAFSPVHCLIGAQCTAPGPGPAIRSPGVALAPVGASRWTGGRPHTDVRSVAFQSMTNRRCWAMPHSGVATPPPPMNPGLECCPEEHRQRAWHQAGLSSGGGTGREAEARRRSGRAQHNSDPVQPPPPPPTHTPGCRCIGVRSTPAGRVRGIAIRKTGGRARHSGTEPARPIWICESLAT